MKKKIIFAVTVFFVCGILFSTIDISEAQNKIVTNNNVLNTSLNQKLDSLIDKLEKIVNLITKNKNEIDENNDFLVKKNERNNVLPVGNATGCAINNEYKLWTSSYYRKESSDWNISMFPSTKKIPGGCHKENFLDLNGDGLVDYFYRYRYESSYIYLDGDVSVAGGITENTCVLLNNGHGWDVAYKCVVGQESIDNKSNNYRLVYFGDCADTNR